MNKENQTDSLPWHPGGIYLTDGTGKTIPVSTLPVYIGRGKLNDISIEDDSLSESHARIDYDERIQEICIEDLDSTNGIFINQRPTSKNILYTNSEIRLGSVTLTYHVNEEGISLLDETM